MVRVDHFLLLSVPYLTANYSSTSELHFFFGFIAFLKALGDEFCLLEIHMKVFPHAQVIKAIKELQYRALLYSLCCLSPVDYISPGVH